MPNGTTLPSYHQILNPWHTLATDILQSFPPSSPCDVERAALDALHVRRWDEASSPIFLTWLLQRWLRREIELLDLILLDSDFYSPLAGKFRLFHAPPLNVENLEQTLATSVQTVEALNHQIRVIPDLGRKFGLLRLLAAKMVMEDEPYHANMQTVLVDWYTQTKPLLDLPDCWDQCAQALHLSPTSALISSLKQFTRMTYRELTPLPAHPSVQNLSDCLTQLKYHVRFFQSCTEPFITVHGQTKDLSEPLDPSASHMLQARPHYLEQRPDALSPYIRLRALIIEHCLLEQLPQGPFQQTLLKNSHDAIERELANVPNRTLLEDGTYNVHRLVRAILSDSMLEHVVYPCHLDTLSCTAEHLENHPNGLRWKDIIETSGLTLQSVFSSLEAAFEKHLNQHDLATCPTTGHLVRANNHPTHQPALR